VARGELRIYLGASPGVGKTYAMLDEGARRAQRGTDVAIGSIDTHGRPVTTALVRQLAGVGVGPTDLDVTGLIARHPDVVLVDELARPGTSAGHEHRWQEVVELLDAGIDVITTVDIGDLESLAPIVEEICGRRAPGTVPDRIVRSASQIQLVDQTPEALRRRLAHGNIVSAESLDAELAQAFSEDKLAALRELTLGWMADRAEEDRRRRTEEGSRSWETREVVLVALTGAPSGGRVIRRAARIADRQRGRLVGVHVRGVDAAQVPIESPGLDEQRRLLRSLGGSYQEVASADVTSALVKVAQVEGATQIVVGVSGRSRWAQMTRGSLITELLGRSPVDVHVVSDHGAAQRPRRARRQVAMPVSLLSPRRQAWGWGVAIVAPMALALVLSALDSALGLSAQLLIMLLGVMLTAVIGGWRPAILAAVGAFLLSNWYFIPPLHALSIADGEDVVSLLSFLAVALGIGGYVSASANRSAEAARVRSDASTLAAMAGAVASDSDPLPALVARLRLVFDATSASLFLDEGGERVLLASDGPDAPARADDADLALDVGHVGELLLVGAPFRAVGDVATSAFLDQLAVAIEQRRLRTSEESAALAAPANELRAALLAAVSHDLRTPLASVKAAVSSLRQDDVEWPADIREELLASIESGTDRLTALVVNLLDMSRLQAGAVELHLATVRLDEVVLRAVLGLSRSTESLDVDLDDRLPGVVADAVLLEHVVTNIVDNAMKWSPPDRAVRVDAAQVDGTVHLRIVDRGPGIPRSQRAEVLQPFQRKGDTGAVEGTGLGLAVADGFARLMGVGLRIEDTPGGGTTVVVSLPVAELPIGAHHGAGA